MPRIAIVGAGPAGVSLAKLLVEHGQHDITIFEASDRVGGKVQSVELDGRHHELGACYLTSGYTRLTPWMEAAGHTFSVLETFVMDDGRPLQEFIYDGRRLGAQIDIARYLLAWAWFHVREGLGWVGDAEYGRLAEPFGPWLNQRGLDAMHRLARRSTAAMGYGYLDRSALLWGFRWNKPSLIYTGLRKNTREPDLGWMTFWQDLARSFNVRLRHRVTDVRREAGEVTLVIERPAEGDGTETVERTFDHVVMAVPMGVVGGFPSATPDERWIADHLEVTRYSTSLIEAKGWFEEPIDTRAYRERLLSPEQRQTPGEPMDRVLVVRRTPKKGGGDRDLYVCYQYIDPRYDPKTADDATDDSLRERLRDRLTEDLAEEGVEVVAVHEQRVWDYFPRLTSEGIARGGVNRLDRMQGVDNVWYTGGSVILESIDHIVDYNAVLALHMQAALTGGGGMGHWLRRAWRASGPATW